MADPQLAKNGRAQDMPENRHITGKDTRFKPGRSGNPGGRPKKLRITRMFEQMLSKPSGRNELKAVVRDILEKRGMAAVLLLREMIERTEGKMAQEVEISGSLLTLSDEDLAVKLAKLIEK
jgi:hypothetical protein